MHWWGTDPESAPLNAVLASSSVSVSPIEFATAEQMRESLAESFIERNPPHLFVANGGLDLLRWGDQGANVLQPLNEAASVDDWLSDVPCEVRRAVSGGTVGADGGLELAVFAVPLNIHRNNVLFYNPAVFERAGVSLPNPQEFSGQEFSYLLDLCSKLEAQVETSSGGAGAGGSAGTTGVSPSFEPMVVGAEAPWTLALLAFENVLVSQSNSDPEDRAKLYESVLRGQTAFDDTSSSNEILDKFVTDVRSLFACLNDDALATSWENAANRFANGQVAMMIGGDWTHAAIRSPAAANDFHYEAIATPGTSGVFVFTADVVTMVRGLPNARRARAVLDHFASLEVQAQFSDLKGSIPARESAVALSDAARASSADFSRKRLIPAMSHFVPSAYRTPMEEALVVLLRDGDDGPFRARLRNLRQLLSDIQPVGYTLCESEN